MVGLDVYPKSQWEGLRSIGMVQRECTIAEKTSLETRYFINSIKPEAKVFAHAVRSHWGVENSLHWCLDVTFREDESRIRTVKCTCYHEYVTAYLLKFTSEGIFYNEYE